MKNSKTPQKNRKTPSTRRCFGVKGQLVGKLGPRGYGRLLDQLNKVVS